MAKPLRIIVMGTGPFALPMLEALLAGPHSVVAVVTRPDHAAAGRRPPINPVRAAAVAAGVPVLDPERINDAERVFGAPLERLDTVLSDKARVLFEG